ncbi:S1 family peptidase [Telluria sp. B2]
MNEVPTLAGVTPTNIQKAGPASLCSVFIRTICSTPSGDIPFGKATGFLYRDAKSRIWLITNWHVVTGRRPDDPGFLVNNIPQSPHQIEVTFPGPVVGKFLLPKRLNLYRNDRPIWREYRRDVGNDVVGIPIAVPPGSIAPCVQDFAERDTAILQPGLDVVVIGFPFEHSVDMPFPVWKRAMVATESAYTVFGLAQTLLDTPGTPGMSGSPVFRISEGVAMRPEQHAQFKAAERGELDLLKVFASLDPAKLKPAPVLNFIGVYAGSTGLPGLDRLSLGRMMLASMVDLIAMNGDAGENPFPPQLHH